MLATEPILWIPSRVWFGFLSKRLEVLYEAHGKLWVKSPPNYGVVSGLFTFLMQSVIFTPPKINSYVRESLGVLQYKRHCDTFGMFFIEMADPSRPWLIEDLPPIDTIEVIRELKLPTTRLRQARQERQEREEQAEFPLGEAPTWKEITSSLQSDPTVLIGRWEEPMDITQEYEPARGDDDSTEGAAAEIFITFTCHLWISLNESWRTKPEKPISPKTLSEALKCWSVDAVMEEVMDATFKPCHSRTDGGAGRPSPSFSERRRMYFPDDEREEMKKNWTIFKAPPGYLAKYHQKRRQLEPAAKGLLNEHLETLLSHCQCLPDSARSGSGGWIWRIERKRIVIITNSNFYQLRTIGREPSKARRDKDRRAPPAHRNARSTAIAMLVNENVPKEVAAQAFQLARRQKDRRSAKSRNYRRPPQRKQKVVVDDQAEEIIDSDNDEDSDDYDGDSEDATENEDDED